MLNYSYVYARIVGQENMVGGIGGVKNLDKQLFWIERHM